MSRYKLFEKLINHNITGKFYECIENLYSEDLSCIRIEHMLISTSKNTRGVEQGCIPSPLLFNMFLVDLSGTLQKCTNLPKINNTETLSCIIWADDLLLLSETEGGLNTMLEKLFHYSEVNVEKTKCMIFNKTERHLRRAFLFGNTKIDTT